MINKVILQGRLVADPELRNTQSGVEVCGFKVAWSKEYKGNKTELFIPCVAWRQTGVFVNTYFTKGQEIIIEGVLTSRNYDDKDGNKRTAFEIVCDQVSFCGSKGGQAAQSQPNQTAFDEVPTDEDCPF